MEWVPNEKDEEQFEEMIDYIWHVPGIEQSVDYTIYRIWSNMNRGKKAGLG